MRACRAHSGPKGTLHLVANAVSQGASKARVRIAAINPPRGKVELNTQNKLRYYRIGILKFKSQALSLSQFPRSNQGGHGQRHHGCWCTRCHKTANNSVGKFRYAHHGRSGVEHGKAHSCQTRWQRCIGPQPLCKANYGNQWCTSYNVHGRGERSASNATTRSCQ